MICFDKEQKFIVTGASSGIGESTALLLNELGATVIGIGRNQQRLDNMKSKCKFSENMFLENKDLAENIEELPAYMKELKNKHGKFQGLAYCAGVSDVTPLQITEYSEMKKVFDINYFAPIQMMKGFADRRINNGEGTSCVFISSIAAVVCEKGQTTYAGSKAALSASLKTIAKELTSSKIRVNSIMPSTINTPMTTSVDNYTESHLHKYPLGFGEVSDVANMVIFLLSNKSKWITAQNYILDCGGEL